ncbi:MAG: hypothetical protein AAF352_01585 [Pseudomonadota bacterium]
MTDIVEGVREATGPQQNNNQQNTLNDVARARRDLPGVVPIGRGQPAPEFTPGRDALREDVTISRDAQQLALREQQRALLRPQLNTAQQQDAINANTVLAQIEQTLRAALNPQEARQLENLLGRVDQLSGLQAPGGLDRQQRIDGLLDQVDDVFEQALERLEPTQRDAAIAALQRLDTLEAGDIAADNALNPLIDAAIGDIDDFLVTALEPGEVTELDNLINRFNQLERDGATDDQLAQVERQIDQFFDTAIARLDSAQQNNLQNRLQQLDNFVNGNVLSSQQQQQLNVINSRLETLLNPQIPTQVAATPAVQTQPDDNAVTQRRTDILV